MTASTTHGFRLTRLIKPTSAFTALAVGFTLIGAPQVALADTPTGPSIQVSARASEAALFASSATAFTLVNAAKKKPYNVRTGANKTKRVVLTFDDCPKSLKQFKKTVRDAEKANVGLALFPTGNCIKSGKFDVKYARKHGMHVFNHSVSHPDLRTLSYSGVKKQLGKPGVVTTYGRPPYGAYNSTVKKAYAAKGMKIWMWNVDTNDWRGKSKTQIVNYVVKTAKPGDTVLMHMQWNAFNGDAIKKIKKGLKKRGIKVCRNYEGTVPAKPKDMWC